MTEEAGAVVGRERTESRNQGGLEIIEGAGRRLAQVGFELGEGQFNRIEIGTVRRQVPNACSLCRDELFDVFDFVGGEVIEDDGVALAQLRTEHVLKISGEDIGIDGPFDQEGGLDPLMAQGGDERGGLPVAMRDGAGAALSDGATPVAAGHLGVEPRLVDKDQVANIPVGLLPTPESPGRLDVRPILLGGASRFFYSSGQDARDDATRGSG